MLLEFSFLSCVLMAIRNEDLLPRPHSFHERAKGHSLLRAVPAHAVDVIKRPIRPMTMSGTLMLASSSEHTLHISDLGKTPVRCPNCGSQKIPQQATAFAAVTSKRADSVGSRIVRSTSRDYGATSRIDGMICLA